MHINMDSVDAKGPRRRRRDGSGRSDSDNSSDERRSGDRTTELRGESMKHASSSATLNIHGQTDVASTMS